MPPNEVAEIIASHVCLFLYSAFSGLTSYRYWFQDGVLDKMPSATRRLINLRFDHVAAASVLNNPRNLEAFWRILYQRWFEHLLERLSYIFCVQAEFDMWLDRRIRPAAEEPDTDTSFPFVDEGSVYSVHSEHVAWEYIEACRPDIVVLARKLTFSVRIVSEQYSAPISFNCLRRHRTIVDKPSFAWPSTHVRLSPS